MFNAINIEIFVYAYYMCGIFGGVSNEIDDFLSIGIKKLIHRGPDNQGIYKFQNQLGLGATRLSMTDPHSRSNQPMIDPYNQNAIVFNGEIYNFRNLKGKLYGNNRKLNTRSDTEILLKLLGQYGTEIIPELEGMFAFAFYHNVRQHVVLSRDFLGKKPLFFYLNNESFLFSSNSNHISNSLKNKKIDINSVLQFLQLGYLLDPNTMYEDIKSVEPGATITIDLKTLKIVKREHYIPKILGEKGTSSNIKKTINDAILERVYGHNNFAISLSGGVDSSIIAMQCAKLGLPAVAYSLSFIDSDKEVYNEDFRSAKLIAQKLKIEFKEVPMVPAKLIPDLLSQYTIAIDRPNSNATGLSQMYLYSQIANDNHRLVLTGDGGDEVFGGYSRYLKVNQFSFLSKLGLLNESKFIYTKNSNFKIVNYLLNLSLKPNSLDFWIYWHLLADSNEINGLMNSDVKIQHFNESYLKLRKLYGNNGRVSELMLRDLSIWLSMESNPRLDSVSMWNSIEARSPFQSEKVIDSGYREMKKSNFNSIEKKILFNHFPNLNNLPINRRKLGFISPLGHWLRSNPEMVHYSISHLASKIPMNLNKVNELKESPLNGDWSKFKILWNFVVLSFWLESNT